MPRTKGAKQFNKQEVDILLKQLKVELPVGSDDWEELTEKYNAIAERKGLPMRDMESLKRKFKSKRRMKLNKNQKSKILLMRNLKRRRRSLCQHSNSTIAN